MLNLTTAPEHLGDAEILLDKTVVPPTFIAEDLSHQGEVAPDIGQKGVASAEAIVR